MGIMDRYILDDQGEPVPCPDLMEWARWLAHGRHLAHDQVGDLEVSTVFLGIDHSFHGGGPPVLWETMIFHRGSRQTALDGYQERYASRESALRGHADAVAKARAAVAQ